MGLSRRPVRLAVDHLAAVEGHGHDCLFWQLDPVRRARLTAAEAAEEKRDWVSEVLREWGACGHVLLDGDRVAAHALYAPPAFAPGSGVLPTAPVTPDAVQLLTVHVDPGYRGGGLGRLLVRAAAKDLVDRDVLALEAFGDSRRHPHGCVLPTGFLTALGFRTQRAHPSYPRMRMELRSTLRWKDEVEQAIGALLDAVRPVKQPKPAPPAVRGEGSGQG
ncbi:GNAT family N-acetyltransferase [Nocardioides jiangxiensis]|uniref:GNAT family N-acetyltransferase n=1 Tax=Nocardioides jiangxiensis TaxID=3064524 RepID=A0ABT9B061_9ACTN|nr:GNAT family N-acetyltransferase [Nocardioides sp. WY-20]MDO7868209.1 GNAT family N-acetyltransferase [Nocardioides sp. WY-20]